MCQCRDRLVEIPREVRVSGADSADRPTPLIGAPNAPSKSSRIPNALIEAFVRLPAAPYQTRSAPPRVSRGRTLQSVNA